MKRRNISCILLSLAIILLAATSCVEPVRSLDSGTDKDLYSISFRIWTEDDALRTKAGEGGPLSGNDVLVDSLFMYCFDANGRFLGRFLAVDLTSAYQDPTTGQQAKPEPDNNTQPAGTFNGEIPPATARIHFVANADCPVGNDKIGMTEEQVMHDPGLVYRSKNMDMSYWGYLRRDTPGQLAALFGGTTTETVLMVRDRLWIEAGSYDKNVFEDNISWVVYNGLNYGYVAPYCLPVGASAMDNANPYQELRYERTESAPITFSLSTVVTPYPEAGGRFVTTEDNMVPFDTDKAGYKPMYVFDDACPVSNPERVTKIIVKAKYKTGTKSTRFFPICITHGYASEPVRLMRGHRYELDLKTLPEASGYATFAEAAASRTFANGALVDIPDQVIEVSDGQFDMRVNYPMVYPLSGETFASTAILIQNPSATSLKVPFEVKKQSSGVDDKTFYFNESDWLDSESSTIPQAHTSSAVTWGAGISTDNDKTASIGSPLNTTITLPLATVGSTLKQSSYNLKGYYIAPVSSTVSQQVHHILMRNLDIYTIEKFQIQEAYSNATENHNAAGNLVLYSTGAGTYRLKFKLPGGTNATGDHDKYPILLYPLQVKVASRTLQPTDIYINEEKQNGAVFGVQVRTTEPGVAPAQLATQNTATEWNYQETGNYWNFWYTYPIVSVPRDAQGNEIEGPDIWIDFKDMRNSSSFSTIPTNVGLYLYIEFFGAANAVSLNQARVAATGVSVSPNGTQGVARGGELQLTATVSPATATYRTVTWSSSNTAVATVDANGLVKVPSTATQNSTATITATCADGNRTATVTIRAQ